MTSTRQISPAHNLNPNAENEHFRISDSIISWMENCKSSRDDNPEISLTNILPPAAQPLLDDHQSSAPGVAWNLVRIFRMKKLKHLVDIRKQLYYLKIYISTCHHCGPLHDEYENLTSLHMLRGDVHAYPLNSLVDVKNGKLYGYLNDLVNRSISHIINCDRCRAKGHYCQLCGPSGLMSSIILNGGNKSGVVNNNSTTISQAPSSGTNTTGDIKISSSAQAKSDQRIHKISSTIINQQPQHQHQKYHHQMPLPHSQASASNSSLASLGSAGGDYELIFPFEIGRVAQCNACGCCYHLQCFIDAGENCPKCERIQRRKADETTTRQQPKQHLDNNHQSLLQQQ